MKYNFEAGDIIADYINDIYTIILKVDKNNLLFGDDTIGIPKSFVIETIKENGFTFIKSRKSILRKILE